MDPAALLPTATLVLTLDLIGTFVFAISGAAAGVKSRLDVFGVSVLAFVAGNAGGITRDVLIGALPPAAVSDWRYVATSLIAGLATFLWYPEIRRLQSIVLLLDAAGLATFAVAGTQKALAFGANPATAALLGMLTESAVAWCAMCSSTIPVVLRAELYAVAALTGSIVVVGGHFVHWPPTGTAIAAAIVCFVMRFIAIRRGWRLPVAPAARPSTTRQ